MGDAIRYTSSARDRALDQAGVLEPLRGAAKRLQKLTEAAYELARQSLGDASATATSPGPAITPQPIDCMVILAEWMLSDKVWYGICLDALPFADISYVRKVTLLAADFLVETHWNTLAPGSKIL